MATECWDWDFIFKDKTPCFFSLSWINGFFFYFIAILSLSLSLAIYRSNSCCCWMSIIGFFSFYMTRFSIRLDLPFRINLSIYWNSKHSMIQGICQRFAILIFLFHFCQLDEIVVNLLIQMIVVCINWTPYGDGNDNDLFFSRLKITKKKKNSWKNGFFFVSFFSRSKKSICSNE